MVPNFIIKSILNISMTKLQNIRSPEETLERNTKAEVYRTPAYSYLPLLNYNPEWFTGRGFDPSAGDGRMIREIVQRGNNNKHYVGDIREEELPKMEKNLGGMADISIGDYLSHPHPPMADFFITNPPFTLAVDFVKKAQTHINGPICILQSVAFQGTKKRSEWLRGSGIAYILNLPRRPKWEVDVPDKNGKMVAASNIWDFAWFVFLPDYTDLPRMDWLVE